MTALAAPQTPHRTRPEALLFINTVHPEEARNRQNLSQIRSHAAKEIRSRARKARQSCLISSRPQCTVPVAKAGGKMPYTIVGSADDSDILAHTSWPQANQYLVPNLSLIKSFTERELFLFDHYVKYIVPFGNGSCHKRRDETREAMIEVQLKHWIPYALSNADLLAALLLQACQSLSLLDEQFQHYGEVSINYRLQCIEATRVALLRPSPPPSDASIAVVMIMASDEFFSGNLDAWGVHLAAMTRMVELRGGIGELGIGGFLKEIITNTPVCFGH